MDEKCTIKIPKNDVTLTEPIKERFLRRVKMDEKCTIKIPKNDVTLTEPIKERFLRRVKSWQSLKLVLLKLFLEECEGFMRPPAGT